MPAASAAAGAPDPAGGSLRRALPALAALAAFATAVAVDLPTVHHEFLLSWDDPAYVTDNPWIRGWTRENLVHVFSRTHFGNYFPLHLVSYMVDYSLWGLDPFGYHLHSVLLAGVNAALAVLVVRRLAGSLLVGFVAAMLFAVHPAHVEAVAWVSIRKDLLATAFVLLSCLAYLAALRDGRVRPAAYAASLGCFAAGLLAKVSIAAFPAFLLLVARLPLPGRARAPWRVAVGTTLPFVAVAGVLAWVTAEALAGARIQAPYAHDPLRALMLRGVAVWRYLGLLTGWPPGRPLYDTPVLSADAASVALSLAGIAVLPVGVALAARTGRPVAAAGLGWIVALLAPAVAFPLVTFMADRYLYAPALGFCWVLAAGIAAATAPLGRRVGRGVAVMLLAAAPWALFTVRSVAYARVWKSSETLWTYATAHSRDYRAFNNLAQVRIGQQRWDEAERLLRLAANVENVVSYQSLALVYFNTGRLVDATTAIERALAIAAARGAARQQTADLEYLRGAVAWVRGEPEQARQAWEAALRANPAHPGAQQWLGVARGELPAPGS